MRRDEITEKFHKILRDEIDLPADLVLRDDTRLDSDEIGADSMHELEITIACEEVFGIDIPDGETDALRTVGAAIDYLERRLAEGATPSPEAGR